MSHSDIAKALALLAVSHGHKVIYRGACQRIEDINESREPGTLRKLRARLRGADLLLVDDSFLRKLPARDDDELADVLMSRYEKGRDDHCEARISRPRPHPSHRAGVEELDLPTGRGVRSGRPA